MSNEVITREQELEEYRQLFPAIIPLIDAISNLDNKERVLDHREIVFQAEVLKLKSDGSLDAKIEQIQRFVTVESLTQGELNRLTDFLDKQRPNN